MLFPKFRQVKLSMLQLLLLCVLLVCQISQAQEEQVLRLDLEGASPTEWCGPLGCTQLQWPEGETWQYDMPDRNTLRTVNGVLYRVQ